MLMAANNKGFTLIENVMAITLAGFLMLAFSSLLAPTSKQTADALTQQRASQVATWLLQEMYSREFDEVNIHFVERCGSQGVDGCSAILGSDADDTNSVRDDFDDYDTDGKAISITDFGLDATGPFRDFLATVTVRYANDNFEALPKGSAPTPMKQVTVAIQRGENGKPLVFNAFRSNF
ncbi:pili assembly chaperone [Vibrio ponticus]|uniref:Pili assembly chaperone n=2 Tax=Vibrio ponticus TaxID=265668 RepID=A0ABX3FJQ5_9VIBR|nr:pili assembly chaperone [Vibrio ponticus]